MTRAGEGSAKSSDVNDRKTSENRPSTREGELGRNSRGGELGSAADREVLELRTRVAELERQLTRLADAEEEILGARAQAQALLDNIPHMAWMKNTEGVFLAVNESFARTAGHDKNDILGKTDRAIWPHELAERYMADDQRVMQSGQRFFVEEPIAEGGDVKWFETFKTPIRNSRGQITGTVGLARDITARKQSEEQQRRLERQMEETQKLESLGVLAGGIAHDFNNLLVGVLANAELVLDAIGDGQGHGDIRQRLLDIRDAAQHAAELTNEMLAYSGRGHFDVRAVSLTETIREMGHLLTASISKKAEVRYELGAGLPAVQADVTQLRQVIMNLITNASDALEDRPGVIRISTGTQVIGGSVPELYGVTTPPPGRYAFIEVTDSGCGMDEETRVRLFEPFFTTKFTGRGLGLSAVQGIVRGHGGGITLHSKPGEGTIIRVLLPCGGEVVSARRPCSEPSSEWAGSGLVLLVDDDARVRTVTELLLRGIGFEVLSVASGRDAIAAFESHMDQLTLVMLDLTMPDMSGDQVLREMRRRNPQVPVLLCSGYSEEEMSHRLDDCDSAGFLQKPYTYESLRARLKQLSEQPSDAQMRLLARDGAQRR